MENKETPTPSPRIWARFVKGFWVFFQQPFFALFRKKRIFLLWFLLSALLIVQAQQLLKDDYVKATFLMMVFYGLNIFLFLRNNYNMLKIKDLRKALSEERLPPPVTNEAIIEEEDKLQLLSVREKEVYDLIQEGYTNIEIAEKLYVELCTIKTHVNHIYKKLGVKPTRRKRKASPLG
jgi:DNA-directed RNA polymerase specialized sigma24 family protein